MSEQESAPVVEAELIGLDFPAADAAWNGIGQASDGTVYCAPGTHSVDCGARLFALVPDSSVAEPVADLDAVLPRPHGQVITQGKVHVDFAPIGEELLGATHIGYQTRYRGTERARTAAKYGPYPGGWFFAVRNRAITPIAQAPEGEGIISMTVDVHRGVAFALTWPHGLLLELDLASRSLRSPGPALGGAGSELAGTRGFICRSLGIDRRTGAVFWSDSGGRIFRYAREKIEIVASLPRAEIWTKVARDPSGAFIGILERSGVLFRFDPSALMCEEIGQMRLPHAPQRVKTTLAFFLDPSDVIHALAVGPGVLPTSDAQQPSTSVYLTHDLSRNKTQVHGPLRSSEGRWISRSESLLVTDRTAYSVCWAGVPSSDRSPHARQVRRHRRHSPDYRFGGHADEVVLARFPVR